MPTPQNDFTKHHELVRACQRGERRAQSELYGCYAQAMYHLALRIVHRNEDAEEVLQQAFVEVFTRLDSFRFESTIGAWIKRVVVNRSINYLKQKRWDFVEIDERTQGNIAEDTNDWADESLHVRTIQQAVNALPEGYRVVFSLYAMEGYDHEEIGEILGISEATSKSQYSRAKAKLREMLGSASNVRQSN